MRKTTLLLFASLIAVLCCSFAFADNGTGNKYGCQMLDQVDLLDNPNGDPEVSAISAVTNAMNEVNSSLPAGVPGGGKGDGCVVVSLSLPDSLIISANHPHLAMGMIELTNCGDTMAIIMVSFEATISLPGVLDTVLAFGPRPVPMQAGQTISHPIRLMVPPLAGTYVLCVTAGSGNFAATSCDSATIVSNLLSGFPIHAWGILVQGTDCVVFQPFRWCHERFPAGQLRGYIPGDTVHVAGELVINCENTCLEADGCIRNNTIDGVAPDPGEPYNGCGVLIQRADCVLYSQQGDSATYALEHYGPFQVGDSVCVRGFLDANCETACSGANGCIHNNSIAPWQPDPHPYFRGCGVVLQGTNCMLFQLFTEQYPNTFSVEISESPSVGDTVCLHGWIDPNCQPPCP